MVVYFNETVTAPFCRERYEDCAWWRGNFDQFSSIQRHRFRITHFDIILSNPRPHLWNSTCWTHLARQVWPWYFAYVTSHYSHPKHEKTHLCSLANCERISLMYPCAGALRSQFDRRKWLGPDFRRNKIVSLDNASKLRSLWQSTNHACTYA